MRSSTVLPSVYYAEMENFTMFVVTVLLCVSINMINAQGEVTV